MDGSISIPHFYVYFQQILVEDGNRQNMVDQDLRLGFQYVVCHRPCFSCPSDLLEEKKKSR